MTFLFIVALILILYGRTYKYNRLIDDTLPRETYLWTATAKKVHYRWYDQRRSRLATFTNIGTYVGVLLSLYMCFGWRVSLLYGLMPTNVSGVAWSTGNYYMTTVLFICTGFYFLSHGLHGCERTF